MKKMLFVISSILFSSTVFSLSLTQQRAVYSEAQILQKQHHWDAVAKKVASIPNYPLNYIFEYHRLKENFSVSSLAEVSAFIEKNSEASLSDSLQREYLYYLADKRAWNEFITFYPQLPHSAKLKCFYFQAKLSQGKGQAIWPEVKKSWLTGQSQPNACDPVFNHYKKQNMISQELIWQRFQLAYNTNKKPLMKYLIKLLKNDNKKRAEQLYALNAAPNKLLQSTLFTAKNDASYPFLIQTFKRLARVDIDLAIKTYQKFDKKLPFSANDEATLKKYFSYRILINNEVDLFPWLDKTLPRLADVKLIEQRLRYAIKHNNWTDIAYWITVLPTEVAEGHTWVYWQARVLEEKKQIKEANKLYQKIAGVRKYYSFLAAQKLGLPYQLKADIVTPNSVSLNALQPRLDHIEELSFHHYTTLVKREWEGLLKGRNIEQQRQLGLYAHNKGWSHLSVVASIRSKSWSAINIRFPEANPALFSENAQKYQIPSSYLYAITRQESSFDQFARSPVGARGYMQLMPATAKETAHMIGLKSYKEQAQLTQGEINVQLGTAYFDSLLKRYKGNRILATAAYNAGPHRVDRWKKNKTGRGNKALSMDSWIEAIPYKETRRYVKNVLAYNVIYQHVLAKPMVFFNDTELEAYW